MFPFSAEHLAKYDDILEPSQVYSLMAIAAASSRAFGVCSRAFHKLESIDANEEERNAYGDLAIQIFSK